MPTPFSVRFMSGRGGNRVETYRVPEGRRAVVRHANLQIYYPAPHELYLRVHGIGQVSLIHASQTQEHWDLRLTAYEHETIEVIVIGQDGAYSIDGFLFADADGRPDDADNTIEPWLAKPVPQLENFGHR